MTYKTGKVILQIQSLIFDLVDTMNEGDPDSSAKAGSGNRTTTKRELREFNRINIVSKTKVIVKANVVVGEQNEIEIQIDDNLQNSIAFDVSNKELTIRNLEKYRAKDGLLINISTKFLESIATEGEIVMHVHNFNNDTLSARMNGLSQLDIDGKVSFEKIELNGSGSKINLSKLFAEKAELRINGSASVNVNVSDRLTVTIDGTGNVYYSGNPSIVRKEIRGVGMVNPEGVR